MKIVLASGSPRRFDLLKMIGIEDFEVIADTDDEVITAGLSPELTVCKIALQKAKNVSKQCDYDDLIIAADTLVYIDGLPLGKPRDRAEAEEMLEILSGRMHTVYTGIALQRNDVHITGAEMTDVYFRELSPFEIARYVKTG